MKVVFLDIDGVLCTLKIHFANGDRGMMKSWDEVSCRLLKRLLDETKAKLVISSTWRLIEDGQLEDGLKKHNLIDYLHKDKYTPSLPGKRGEEIEKWLKRNPDVEKYVIIDDDSDMLENQIPFLIKTHINDGFGFKHYEDALKILNNLESNIIVM